MSTTVIETLLNAEINLTHSYNQVQKKLGLNQLHNAIIFLEKGYEANDKMDDLLDMYFDALEEIPEKN